MNQCFACLLPNHPKLGTLISQGVGSSMLVVDYGTDHTHSVYVRPSHKAYHHKFTSPSLSGGIGTLIYLHSFLAVPFQQFPARGVLYIYTM